MAVLGGISGSVTRDFLINQVPARLTNPAYIMLSLAAGAVGYLASNTGRRFRQGLSEFATSPSLAWFAIVGTQKGIQVGYPRSCVFLRGNDLRRGGPTRCRPLRPSARPHPVVPVKSAVRCTRDIAVQTRRVIAAERCVDPGRLPRRSPDFVDRKPVIVREKASMQNTTDRRHVLAAELAPHLRAP